MFHVKDVADGKRRSRSALTGTTWCAVHCSAVPLRAAEASEAMWITRLFRSPLWIFTSVEYTTHETYAKKINGNGGRMAS